MMRELTDSGFSGVKKNFVLDQYLGLLGTLNFSEDSAFFCLISTFSVHREIMLGRPVSTELFAGFVLHPVSLCCNDSRV